jgi:EAL domain-containing protein (putative c-di-GMP-specific phosphodiesterase class I)
MVARLGGDEFVVLAAGAGREDAARLAERLLETFREPYSLKDTRVYTSASVGIVPGEGSSGDTAGILRDADLALRRAKTSLQTNQAFFDQELRDRAEDLFELEADLRRAISEEGLSQGLAQDPSGVMPEELYLEYQPMYETDGGRPVGAEALVRWRHPRRGSIPPDRFIPMAEDTGLVVELGRLILHRACHQMRSWRQGGHELRRISVNVSPVQLERPRFVEDVLEAIQESGIEARHLQLEFTEYQRINTPEVAETLRRLADAGVSMCIDDFGTGYSSLDYLGKLPLRGLKIDRSFVQPLPEQAGGRNRNIVEAILALSDKMGLEVTAEGVETREQLDYLRSRGCGFVQGYLFSKPKPAEEVFPTD